MKLKWDAFPRWSFSLSSAWGSIETTTIRKTHPTLALEMLARLLSLNDELKDRDRKRFTFDRIQSEPSDMKFQMIDADSSIYSRCLQFQIVKLNIIQSGKI